MSNLTNEIFFLILNMDKSNDRYKNISLMLDNINCKYMRVSAVDGYNMITDVRCKEILLPRDDLLNQTFECLEINEKWTYDGSILKSFPGLQLNGHQGTKGLTLSNIIAFKLTKSMNYKWYCILEDDAEIDKNIFNKLQDFILNQNNMDYDIVLLDQRANGFGGTAGILYNKRIIDQLLIDIHPLSNFSMINERKYKTVNLWDWKLWSYIRNYNIKYYSLPCIKSGNFSSTINI
jgi:hypothetical protein